MKSNLPGPPPTPRMTPEERKIWLASKAAPDGALLMYESELAVIQRQIVTEHALRVLREKALTAIMLDLGDYYKNEPDLPNAVGAAVFDAYKFKTAVESAQGKLGPMKERLDQLASNKDLPIALTIDALDLSAKLGELIQLFKGAADARRQRRTISK